MYEAVTIIAVVVVGAWLFQLWAEMKGDPYRGGADGKNVGLHGALVVHRK